MKNIKTILKMAIMLSLLTVGFSAGAEEENSNLKKAANAGSLNIKLLLENYEGAAGKDIGRPIVSCSQI